MVGGSSERNTGISSGDEIGVSGYFGDGRSFDVRDRLGRLWSRRLVYGVMVDKGAKRRGEDSRG